MKKTKIKTKIDWFSTIKDANLSAGEQIDFLNLEKIEKDRIRMTLNRLNKVDGKYKTATLGDKFIIARIK